MTLEAGDKAPDFTMATDGGGSVSLAGLKGKKVILYFYPKDDTPGCTKEACGFRDNLPDFSGLDAEIIGVSKDSVAKHDKFKAKYDLPFTLASDEDGRVCEAYGPRVEVHVRQEVHGHRPRHLPDRRRGQTGPRLAQGEGQGPRRGGPGGREGNRLRRQAAPWRGGPHPRKLAFLGKAGERA